MNLNALLAMMAPPAKAGTQADPKAEFIKLIGMMVLFGVMIYFVMIRPQQKRAKAQTELLKSLRPGDKVVTNAGILGVVVTVKEKSVTLRSADTKLELAKSAVTEILERGSES